MKRIGKSHIAIFSKFSLDDLIKKHRRQVKHALKESNCAMHEIFMAQENNFIFIRWEKPVQQRVDRSNQASQSNQNLPVFPS